MKSKIIANYARYFLVILLAVILSADNTFAQNNDIKASAPGVVSTNKAFNYSVSAQKQGEISPGNIEGIRVISGPSQMVSYQSSNVNGKLTTTMQVSYSYMMIAEKAGEYTIPPATLKAGGETYKSNPVTIRVVKGATDAKPGEGMGQNPQNNEPSPVILRLMPSKTELYEGEQLVVATKIYVRTRIERPSLNSPSYEGFWVEELEADQSVRNESVQGYNYNSQVVKRDLLTAQRKGDIKIEPASLDVTILKRAQRRRSAFDDFFDDPFFSSPFDRYEKETRVINSNPLTVIIKPLPSGAPDGFKGAVGDFNVSAELKADSVQTNSAISLVVEITGRGNLNLLESPEIDFPPDLESFEPKRSENINHSQSGTEGRVRFEYVIIPRHNGNYRISPVLFAFFDPDAQKYEHYESPEFKFTAYGGQDGEGESGVQSGFFREDVRDIAQDIRYIKLDPGKFVPVASFLILNTWVYIYIFGGLALLILLVLLWRNKLRKEADIFYVRNKRAHKVAKKRLKNAYKLLQEDKDDFYEEILKAFWGYLGDRMGINTADLSRERISDELETRKIDDKLQQKLWEVVDECEYSRYSPESSGGKKELYEKAADCMRKMEQNI